MRETKFSLGLAIAISLTLVTSASVGSVLAAGNMTAAGGAASNMTKAASNATSSTSSNPLAKIGQALSGLFGGKK